MLPPKATKTDFFNNLSSLNLQSDPQILKAIDIAISIHKDQKRDDGTSYLEQHIWPISIAIIDKSMHLSDLKRSIIIAILHDSIEDGNFDIHYGKNLFGKDVIDGIKMLTKQPKERDTNNILTQDQKMEMNREYLLRLHNCSKDIAIIKLEDRLNNLMSIIPDTIKLRPEKYIRYLKETHELFIPLIRRHQLEQEYLTLFYDELDRIKKSLPI